MSEPNETPETLGNGPDTQRDLNNGGSDRAVEGEGSQSTLDELYDTLGSVQAGIDLRKQEMRDSLAPLAEQEADLLQQREEAATAGDSERYQQLTAELEQLGQAHTVLNDEELGLAQHERENSDGDADSEHAGGRDDPHPGDGPPLADQQGDGGLQRDADRRGAADQER